MSNDVPVPLCPQCGTVDAAVKEPWGAEPGAPALCLHCGHWNVYDARLKLREPSPTELVAIMTDRQAMDVARTWDHLSQRRKHRYRQQREGGQE